MPLSEQESPLSKSFITKVREKSLLGNVWTHDFTERLKMRRVVQAKADGLDDYNVGTYPQELLIVKKGVGIKELLLGAAMFGSGAAGGIALLDALQTKEIIEKVTTEVYDYKVQVDVERN
jgi:hypothetical protein